LSQGDLITIGKEAVTTALMLAAPFLVASLALGLVVSVLQAATQIHEQTIVFVPKIIATAAILIFLGSWMIAVMVNFTVNLFTLLASLS